MPWRADAHLPRVANEVPWKAGDHLVKPILRKYKYMPHLQDAAVELVLQQAQALEVAWAA